MEADGANPKAKRSYRNYLIEPMAQVRMGLRLMMINVAFVVAMGVVISSGYFAQYSLLVGTNLNGADSPLQAVLNRHTIALSVIFILFILVLMAAVIVYTHRIYGAVVAIQRTINDLNAGRYEKRCNLRSHDELQDLAASLNDLAQTLQSKHGKA